MTSANATFSSRLAPTLAQYVDLKRALSLRFDNPTRTLQSLDRFLHDQATQYPDLDAAAFQAGCQTQKHLASGERRDRMLQVYNFCLYRHRTEPRCFVPDPALFPGPHPRLQPYIFSEQEVARLLGAASGLKRLSWSPLRPEVMRLAIVLLFTTGIRRGELLRLTLSDYDRRNATLLIRESKFHKPRLLPLNGDIAEEMDRYLHARAQGKLPVSSDTALIGNATPGGRAYSGRNLALCLRPLLQKCSIFTHKGRLPRIHDFRFSFAVNALLRWYRRAPTLEPNFPCWPPIGGTFLWCPLTTTCTGSNPSERPAVKDSPATTANWLCPYRAGPPNTCTCSASPGRGTLPHQRVASGWLPLGNPRVRLSLADSPQHASRIEFRFLS